MKEYFLKLYQYNAWANHRVIGCLERQAVNDEKILKIFSHLVSAQSIWFNRIKGLPPSPYELWKKYDLVELKAMVEETSQNWLTFLHETESLNRILKYKNYVGEYYENNVEHIMMHLVNHGTYHRGQVALLLREKGFEPINTDFITYDRVQLGQLKD